MKQGQPSQLVIKQVTDLLMEKTGVDARSLDASRLQWVIEGRCRSLKIADPVLYVQHLSNSETEVEALVDATVVGETRFFRDAAVFDHLREWLPVMASQFAGEIRVLSAPCSTGQEAYSIAALMLEAGIPASRFTIDALDISHASLATARKGHYPLDALRHVSPAMQRACGTLVQKQWVMHEELRNRIRFVHRNLADPAALAEEKSYPYHLIFCRNLFIYLHAEARASLAASLSESLLPGGRLILGSADHATEISRLFTSVKPAASFAFTHRVAAPEREWHKPTVQVTLQSVFRPRSSSQTSKVQIADERSLLTTAEGLYQRALEDQRHGDLRRAERRCRQALYLDPQMLPAMELLETLWREHPNLRLRRALGARIMRSRGNQDAQKETA